MKCTQSPIISVSLLIFGIIQYAMQRWIYTHQVERDIVNHAV